MLTLTARKSIFGGSEGGSTGWLEKAYLDGLVGTMESNNTGGRYCMA